MPGNSQGMGFQVFDSQGRLTLNLVDKAAKVETVITIPPSNPPYYLLPQTVLDFPIPGVTPDTHFVIPAPWYSTGYDYYADWKYGAEVYNGGVRYLGHYINNSMFTVLPSGVNLIVVRMS